MLKILDPTDAAFIVYFINTKQDWQLAFNPITRQQIQSDITEQSKIFMYKAFIENAVESGELPAMQKPKGRAIDKKNFERLGIPKEMLDTLPQYDYWITLDDLFAFFERPSVISKEYPHGRDALARIICALIDDKSKFNERDLFEYLAQKIDSAEIELEGNLKLGDSTLKGTCREIIDSFDAIKCIDSDMT